MEALSISSGISTSYFNPPFTQQWIAPKPSFVKTISYQEDPYVTNEEWRVISEILAGAESQVLSVFASESRVVKNINNKTVDRRATFNAGLHKGNNPNIPWSKLPDRFPKYDTVTKVFYRSIWGRAILNGIPALEKCHSNLSSYKQKIFRRFLSQCHGYDEKSGFLTWREMKLVQNVLTKQDCKELPTHSKPDSKTPIDDSLGGLSDLFLTDEEWERIRLKLAEAEKQALATTGDKLVRKRIGDSDQRKRAAFNGCLYKEDQQIPWRNLPICFPNYNRVINVFIRAIWGVGFSEGVPILELCCSLLPEKKCRIFRRFLSNSKGYSEHLGFFKPKEIETPVSKHSVHITASHENQQLVLDSTTSSEEISNQDCQSYKIYPYIAPIQTKAYPSEFTTGFSEKNVLLIDDEQEKINNILFLNEEWEMGLLELKRTQGQSSDESLDEWKEIEKVLF